MLAADGKCRSFDAAGSGYVRSEAIVALYLQFESSAKRIYATVVHAKNNCDGGKDDGKRRRFMLISIDALLYSICHES